MSDAVIRGIVSIGGAGVFIVLAALVLLYDIVDSDAQSNAQWHHDYPQHTNEFFGVWYKIGFYKRLHNRKYEQYLAEMEGKKARHRA